MTFFVNPFIETNQISLPARYAIEEVPFSVIERRTPPFALEGAAFGSGGGQCVDCESMCYMLDRDDPNRDDGEDPEAGPAGAVVGPAVRLRPSPGAGGAVRGAPRDAPRGVPRRPRRDCR